MSLRTVVPRHDIDRHVARLGRSLRGPGRVKRSLLAEARDGLIDAAAAYERAGLDPVAAERRAMADFGAVDEIAPSYQAELAAAQSRRTAIGILLVIALQIVAWDHPLPLVPEQPEAPSSSPVGVVDTAVEWIGALYLLAAVGLVVGARFAARRPSIGGRLGRVTGLLGWLVGVHLAASAVVLNTLSPSVSEAPILAIVVPVALFVALPVTWLVRSSRRCLALA